MEFFEKSELSIAIENFWQLFEWDKDSKIFLIYKKWDRDEPTNDWKSL